MNQKAKTPHLKKFIDFLSSDPNEYFTAVEEREIYQSHQQKITANLDSIIDLVFYEDQPNEQDRSNFQYLLLNRFLDVLRESEVDTNKTDQHITNAPCSLFKDAISKWTPST